MRELAEAFHRRMAALLGDCQASVAGEQAARLREAVSLGNNGKATADRMGGAAAGLRIERLISEAAFECAALEVIGLKTEFEMSCGRTQKLSARVRLPGRTAFYSAEGQTIALALLAAWATAHLAEIPGELAAADSHHAGEPQ